MTRNSKDRSDGIDATGILMDWLDTDSKKLIICRYKRRPYATDMVMLNQARQMQDDGILSIMTRRKNGMIEHVVERV